MVYINMFCIIKIALIICAFFLFSVTANHGVCIEFQQRCMLPKGVIVAKILHLIYDRNDISQIIQFLNEQEKFCGSIYNSLSWTSLCNVYYKDQLFTNTALLMTSAADVEDYNQRINNLYEAFSLSLTDPYDDPLLPAHIQFSDLLLGSSSQPTDNILLQQQLSSPAVNEENVVRREVPGVGVVPPETIGSILQPIPEISAFQPEHLAGIMLSLDSHTHFFMAIYNNVLRWWHGEISGARATKNIMDSMAGVGGGAAASAAGAAIGSFGGPIGSIVGGTIGAYAGGFTAAHFSEEFTLQIFDLPRSEALENAYRALGVHHRAPDEEIDQAFRALSMKYHPDRPGGSSEKFYQLQTYMAIIKAARGGESIP